MHRAPALLLHLGRNSAAKQINCLLHVRVPTPSRLIAYLSQRCSVPSAGMLVSKRPYLWEDNICYNMSGMNTSCLPKRWMLKFMGMFSFAWIGGGAGSCKGGGAASRFFTGSSWGGSAQERIAGLSGAAGVHFCRLAGSTVPCFP